MELKKYQQEVINDLVLYLEEVEKTNNISKAFSNLWENKEIGRASCRERVSTSV